MNIYIYIYVYLYVHTCVHVGILYELVARTPAGGPAPPESAGAAR